jgi:hypothetical protein
LKRNLRSPLSQAVAAAGLLLLILAFTGAPASAQAPPIAETDLQYDLLLQDLGRRDCPERRGTRKTGMKPGIQQTNCGASRHAARSGPSREVNCGGQS